MKQSLASILTIVFTTHAMAFSLNNFGFEISGDEIKEKIKSISKACKKDGDKENCKEEKKDLVINGIKLPSINTRN